MTAATRGRSPRALSAALAAAIALLAACAGGAAPAPAARGHFPVATPPPQATPLSASPGHAQLVAIGDRVLVHLADATLLVGAYGPDVDDTPPSPGMPFPQTVSGVITVSMAVQQGSVTVDPDQFAVRGEDGKPVALTADPAGPASGAQGTTLTLKLGGRFADGDGIITWARGGHDVVSWDFSVEID